MAKALKTQQNEASVTDFLSQIEDENKRKDAFAVRDMMEKITGHPAKMWGASIIGFDSYHNKSKRSSQESDWPIVGFSPRKQNLTLYIMPGFERYKDLTEKLGTFKTGKSCLYLKKLSDVNQQILQDLIKCSVEDMRAEHHV